MSYLKNKYHTELISSLQKALNLKSVMAVPRLKSITLNMCTGEAVKNPKILDSISKQLTVIAGQKAIKTKAKKAIANFKLREGVPIGSCVTLRRDKMWIFMEKLIHFSIPQMKDFRGLSRKSFDGHGNYNMGVKEQLIFAEIDYDQIDKIRGLNVSITTTAKTDSEALSLLEALGMPFRQK